MKFINVVITAFCCLITMHSKSQLYVQNGATFTTTSGAVVTLQNMDLQDYGTINQTAGTGKFLFNGTASNSISGSNTALIDNMEIAKLSTGKLTLAQNLNIGTNLLFTSGNIDVGNYKLQLQPGATLSGESETSHLLSSGTTGTVSITAALNMPGAANPGNLGAVITSSQNMGSTTITRGFTSQSNGLPGSSSILRYYDITPTNNTALNATLRINYLDAEVNGLNEGNFIILKSDNNINFTPMGFTSRDAANNYVELTGISNFSRWTVSASDNPLPVTLISFSATCENSVTQLKWQSGTEINAADYIIQKSTNTIDWVNLQTVAATNNISGSNYSYTDEQPGTGAYYRLKMVDKDGTYAYSAIFTGGCTVPDVPFAVYPNPAHSHATIALSAKDDSQATINIYSADGKLLSQYAWSLQKGANSYTLPGIALLPAGTYSVKIMLSNGASLQSMLIKQ